MKAGQSKDQNDPHFVAYKNSKRLFRKAIRLKTYQYEMQNIQELCDTQEIDSKYFWYKVNKTKIKTQGTNSIIGKEGNLITNPDDIRQEWTEYYSKLYVDLESNLCTFEAKL